jgi:hypothetical protein
MPAEPEMAVCDERSHPTGLSECRRLAVAGLAARGVEAVGISRALDAPRVMR